VQDLIQASDRQDGPDLACLLFASEKFAGIYIYIYIYIYILIRSILGLIRKFPGRTPEF
jgi:hypothetical protein